MNNKCSECSGDVIVLVYSDYRPDGSSRGEYRCQGCGKVKSWSRKASNEVNIIDMS